MKDPGKIEQWLIVLCTWIAVYAVLRAVGLLALFWVFLLVCFLLCVLWLFVRVFFPVRVVEGANEGKRTTEADPAELAKEAEAGRLGLGGYWSRGRFLRYPWLWQPPGLLLRVAWRKLRGKPGFG